MQMTRRRLLKISLITLITATLLIVISVLLGNFLEQRRVRIVSESSGDFVNKWGNFKDEASSEYLLSISKYLSEDINTEYYNSSQFIIENRGDRKPITSSFKINKEPIITKAGKNYTATISGTRNYSDERGKYEERVYLTWEKESNKYVITDLYGESE